MEASEAKVYHNGEWVDPASKIMLHHFFINENGIYELKIQVDDKIIIMKSDDKVHCENCARSNEDVWPVGKVWCNKMGRYMDRDGFCSYGKEKEK